MDIVRIMISATILEKECKILFIRDIALLRTKNDKKRQIMPRNITVNNNKPTLLEKSSAIEKGPDQ